MMILIKTSKPDLIEKELKQTIEKYKNGWKPTRKMRFMMKIAKIDLDMINNAMFFDYKKIDDSTFEFILNYPNIEHTKKYLINSLNVQLKRIDDKIEVSEKKG